MSIFWKRKQINSNKGVTVDLWIKTARQHWKNIKKVEKTKMKMKLHLGKSAIKR